MWNLKENKKNPKRIYILSGGRIDRELLKEYIRQCKDAKLLCVDGGLKTAWEEKLTVDYIVGDFDTIEPQILAEYQRKPEIEIRAFDPVKDNTDTDIALEYAIEKHPESIYLFGATGTRLDHTLGNLHILYKALQAQVETYIIDSYNKIYMIKKGITLQKDRLYGTYLSLIPFTQEVTDVTLTGFKYPLCKKTMRMGESLGISNEVTEKEAVIDFKEGIFLVIEARD